MAVKLTASALDVIRKKINCEKVLKLLMIRTQLNASHHIAA